MYWIYRTAVQMAKNEPLMAHLVEPTNLREKYRDEDFKSSKQIESYPQKIQLKYQIMSRDLFPDNYADSHGFDLFSERLIELVKQFNVKFELFPVIFVDNNDCLVASPKYYTFHSLEGVIDAIDEVQSNLKTDPNDRTYLSIQKLVLDYDSFEHRPLFTCNKAGLQLMRDDLKQAIKAKNITGFQFLKPEKYSFGLEYPIVEPEFWE
jgi:hypothetical protein